MIPYCHPDYSWTHTRNWHVNRYTTVLNEVADCLERYPDYKYYIDCYASFIEPVLERCPELAERLQPYIDQKRLEVCGTYSNIRPNMVDGEAFIRNMAIGRDCFNSIWKGLSIRVYADPCDVCASHSQLPQLLRQGGFEYMRFLRPGEVFAKKGVPWEFVFRGQDESEIIANLTQFYGFYLYRQTKPCFDGDIDKSVAALYENEFKHNAPNFRVPFILKGFGVDDARPMRYWDAEHQHEDFPFAEYMEKWRDAGIDMQYATPIDYFQALETVREQLYVVDEPVDICDVCFNVCLGGEKSLVHKRLKGAENLLSSETAGLLAHLVADAKKTDYTDLWKENLFVSAHATQWALEEDSADLHKRADRVMDRAEELRMAAYRDLTKFMPFSLRKQAVFFNPHDKAVRRAALLTITTPDPAKLRLIDGFGTDLLFQTAGTYKWSNGNVYEWDFLVAIDIPACGYNCVTAKEGAVDASAVYHIGDDSPVPRFEDKNAGKIPVGAEPFFLGNGNLSLRFESGRLASIYDCRSKKTLFGPMPFNSVVFREFGEINVGAPVRNIAQLHDAVFDEWKIDESGPVRFRVTFYGTVGPHPVEQTITLVVGTSDIVFETHVDWQQSEGFMTVGAPCGQIETLFGGIPFGTEDRRIDLEHYDKTKGKTLHEPIGTAHRTIEGLFYAKDFVGYSIEGIPVSLVAASGDRYFLYNKETGEIGHIVNFTVGVAKDWWSRINSTAFRSFGPHVFSHVISVGEPKDSRAEIQAKAEGFRRATEYVRPINGGVRAGILPEAGSFVCADKDNVRLSAFYMQADAAVLRIWEAAGEGTCVSVALPCIFKNAKKTDFLGNEQKEADCFLENGKLKISLRPHEIATIKLHIR